MKQIIISLVILFLTNCSTVHYNKKDILKKDYSVQQLSNQLEEAAIAQVPILSPKNFIAAQSKLELALEKARISVDGTGGNSTAKEGLEMLARANEVAEKSRKILGSSLKKRSDAQNAQAHKFLEREFNNLDNKLIAAGRLVEDGYQAKALKANVNIAEGYSDLEVRSLKTGIGHQAELSIQEAYGYGAAKTAPKTYAAAKNELDLAKKSIDVEKDDTEKAQSYVERAQYLAEKSKTVADIAALHNAERATREDVVLWYQEQLSKIFRPLDEALPFNLGNDELVNYLQTKIQDLMAYTQALEANERALQERMDKLNNKIVTLVNHKDRASLQAENKKELDLWLQNIFTPAEAEVLRQGDNILIRSYGFNFVTGSADLKSRNYILLNKLVNAILKFPQATIKVVGHTDSTGSNELNLRLSNQRAQNIADFLIKVAGIDANRVQIKGLGDTQPLAKNSTVEGRAKNRRIEIHIINNH